MDIIHTTFQIPTDVLDDLCSRFIINLPREEKEDLIRLFFQIEFAHWYYLDFMCEENPSLKSIGIKEFSAQIFRHCPSLVGHADNVARIMGSWKEYKMAVPTYGAILLDPSMQNCLLVQGYLARSSWGFPKGKVNEDEDPVDCAVREVLEETNFDIRSLIEPEHYIEYKVNEQLSRLYIVRGVPKKFDFHPRTRKEIKKIEWFRVDYLPTHRKDNVVNEHYGITPNSFFMVVPFVKQLQRWIRKQQTQGQHRGESISGRRSVPGDTRVSRSSEHVMSGYGYDDSLHASPAITLADSPENRRSAQERMYAQMMKDEFNEYNMLASESAAMSASGGGTPRGKSAQGRGRGGATPTFTVGGDRGGRAIHGRQQQPQQQRGGRQIRAQKALLRQQPADDAGQHFHVSQSLPADLVALQSQVIESHAKPTPAHGVSSTGSRTVTDGANMTNSTERLMFDDKSLVRVVSQPKVGGAAASASRPVADISAPHRFTCKAWTDFHLDSAAILAALFLQTKGLRPLLQQQH